MKNNLIFKTDTEVLLQVRTKSLANRSYHCPVIQNETIPKCRICEKYDENINHIIKEYSELEKNEYSNGHNKVATYLHWKVYQNHKMEIPIQTDMEMTAKRPDIFIKHRKFKMCMHTEIALPSERNNSMKIIKKLSIKNDLQIEIYKMQGMKTEIVPTVIVIY